MNDACTGGGASPPRVEVAHPHFGTIEVEASLGTLLPSLWALDIATLEPSEIKEGRVWLAFSAESDARSFMAAVFTGDEDFTLEGLRSRAAPEVQPVDAALFYAGGGWRWWTNAEDLARTIDAASVTFAFGIHVGFPTTDLDEVVRRVVEASGAAHATEAGAPGTSDSPSALVARVQWAGLRYLELAKAVADFLESRPFSAQVEFDPDLNLWQWRAQIREAVPAFVGFCLGDIVHNLRATVDNLYSALVVHAPSNALREGHFPVCIDEKYWLTRERKLRRALPSHAFYIIEQLQPFHHPIAPERDVLRILHNLWNSDKHEATTATGGFSQSQIRVDELKVQGGFQFDFPNTGALEPGAVVARLQCGPLQSPPSLSLDESFVLTLANPPLGVHPGGDLLELMDMLGRYTLNEVVEPLLEYV
jgi:hypothetical protein